MFRKNILAVCRKTFLFIFSTNERCKSGGASCVAERSSAKSFSRVLIYNDSLLF